MKYFLVAGEASGDLHASNLMKSLRELDKEADFRFFGGDLMLAAGGKLLKHYREMAYMGFIPVLMNLRKISQNMNLCKKEIASYQPDAVILIDYPGFNLSIAKFVRKQLRIPVFYYISPKIWAWKEWRIKSIRQNVDKMLCILPFEVDFYQKHQYSVEYVGNPTVDAIDSRPDKGESSTDFITENKLENKPIIAILAGSRKQEIKDNLPAMLEAVANFPDCQAVIAGAPGLDPDYYQTYIGKRSAKIVFAQTYRLLQHSKAALVTSGTATLETALLNVPQVVCYKTPLGGLINFAWDHFFKVKYISLVNLIADRKVVKELFGKYFSVENISSELNNLLNNKDYRRNMLNDYLDIQTKLGKPGASHQAAKAIYSRIKK
ncbi:lipid-A-disaccharide synthase [Bacteroidales bacterium OttesenSCG-928-A17]|nr:lipid-A-disaccharide synthase [Bacteroidales bacterium OttesenSCG-928-A17]